MTRITVLGGGNTAFSMAAKLALDGHEVMLWEHPNFRQSLDPIAERLQITLRRGDVRQVATLAGATTEASEALGWSEILLCSVPSYAHGAFITALLPYLRSGHVLTLLPGNLGALAFAKALQTAGINGVLVAETDTAPYVCRKTGPAEATIFGTVPILGLGAFPASQKEEVLPQLAPLFDKLKAYEHVLEAGLSAMNPVVHPAGVLMNAGRIERSQGEFRFYEEGVTPSVVAVIEALDQERLHIGKMLGMGLTPVADAFHQAGFGPAGDLWSVINGSQMLTAMRAPGTVNTRWLTEDVPFGLVTWAELATAGEVEAPVLNALITLASSTLDIDFRLEGRTLTALGISDMSDQELHSFLTHGS